MGRLLWLLALVAGVLADPEVTEVTEVTDTSSSSVETATQQHGNLKLGDRCEKTVECVEGAVCDKDQKSTCQCHPDLRATNHYDKCGKEAGVNESCFFNEQCEALSYQTECRDSRCVCRFELTPVTNRDGSIECKAPSDSHETGTYVDPAMIGILAGMALMFIIICVVLRLFSKARWRENRTIFNTPNPRLMNVSLLRDSKLLHGAEARRGSRGSVRGPSRQPSMASLRPQSPSASQGSRTGSRRGSRASSNASATSTRSPKSPTKIAPNNTVVPVLENVTIEVQEPKA